jgi:diaminopimelate decarboxylase
MTAGSHSPAADLTLLESIAAKVGTPYWLYDATEIRRRIEDVRRLCATEGLQPRYALKACPATRVLREMRGAGIWIDAVSGNECLRALRAGYPAGPHPPQILFTADVFRDNSLEVVLQHGILPNLGSPRMLAELREAGYHGPIALRVNPGFGHGHVNACDTGGPSSKHGIWFEEVPAVAAQAARDGHRIVQLHAHIGSGPQQAELRDNLRHLAERFAQLAPQFPHLEAVSLGGGLPYNYRQAEALEIDLLARLLAEARRLLSDAASRPIRLEIEPGRYYVASACTLVSRVKEVKSTQSNEKGAGATFAMVDAGFVDLVRPAMYGSYHRITIPARNGQTPQPVVVAGPLCESGDVFTRDASELLAPRDLALPQPGDLLCLHDAGAYGYAMASTYNSIGRAPQVWHEADAPPTLMTRRETFDDLLRLEAEEPT